MPKINIVSQAELASVLASYNALGQTILGIRRRIEAGAAVEEGIYTADSNRGDSITQYDRSMNGIGMFGLDLETKGLPSDVYQEPAVAAEPAEPESSEPALPEWLTETPLDTEYWLAMYEGGIDAEKCQTIELSRREYLLFKVYLAKLRGLSVPTAEPQGLKKSGNVVPLLWDELTPEEIAAVPEATHAN